MSVQSSDESSTNPIMSTKCSIKGCDRDAYAKGYCSGHYKRQHRDPRADMTVPLREDRGELAEVNVRVPVHVRAALESAGGCYAMGAAVLQAWADGLPMPARPTKRRKAA